MEKILTVKPAALSREALDMLSAALAHDTTGGLQSLAEVCGAGGLYEVEDAGGVVMRYVLAVNQYAHGREAFIVAAAGAAPGVDLTATALAAIEQQAAGCDALALHTRRMGLVKKLARHGFAVDGFILRKRLQCH